MKVHHSHLYAVDIICSVGHLQNGTHEISGYM
jgi:hypothetical protein